MTTVAGRFITLSSVLTVFGLLAVSVAMFTLTEVKAQRPICHAAIVIDKSGSVDDDQLETMRQQITRLFQPGGIYSDYVRLAFWSFSSTTRSNVNYNSPFNGFVSSRGVDSNFQTNLYRLASGGGTNYEQGLGYDGFVLNNQQVNTFDDIDSVINQAQIIVFMTDGQPNTPGGGGDNNPTARSASRQAALKHLAQGKLLSGGIIQGMNQRSLNYMINGSDTNAANTFVFSSDYTTLSRQLTTIVNQRCAEIVPPVEAPAYSLTPTASSANAVVTGTDSASFTYNVHNSADEGASDITEWKIERIIVHRGTSAAPLAFGGQAYRDGYSCGQMLNLIGGPSRGECELVASGTRAFNSDPPNTSLDDSAPGATSVVLDDAWPVGTKVCYTLSIAKPTQGLTPQNRYSAATCLAVGKRPFVQVHGGDLRVGRYFSTDVIEVDEDDPRDPARIVTSVTPKNDGYTYGSWGEYGVFSPGLVIGFGSRAGLAGGYAGSLPNAQEFWSELTFANTDDEYGLYVPNDIGQGRIPDYKAQILAGEPVVDALVGVPDIAFNGNGVTNGLYRKSSGNLNIDASVLVPGKVVYVYVPEGTVTIRGNLTYSDGPYRDLSEIPQMVIIARRIEIQPNVAVVSAWLISDHPEDGTVNTCNDPASALTIQICNVQLRINGPVIARNIELRRTAGAGAGGASGSPAEIINLPIDAYLWSQVEGRSDSRAQTTFVTELPPYF
jgi:hypothetical protein